MIDVLRSAGPEQGLKQWVSKHAGVERVFQAMDRLDPAGELEQRGPEGSTSVDVNGAILLRPTHVIIGTDQEGDQ